MRFNRHRKMVEDDSYLLKTIKVDPLIIRLHVCVCPLSGGQQVFVCVVVVCVARHVFVLF